MTAQAVPAHKVIPGTGGAIVVDAFRYAHPGVKAYFLTHAHSDHYSGLNDNWCNGPIYCSETTARLVVHLCGVDPSHLRPLPMKQPVMVAGVEVTLVDANHCPGAVQLLFRLPGSGARYLHCGDMRFCASMTSCPLLGAWRGCEAVFLDTTYCHPKHTFPLQEESVDYVVQTLGRFLEEDRAAEAAGATAPMAGVDAATGAFSAVEEVDPGAALGPMEPASAALSDDPSSARAAVASNQPQGTEKPALRNAAPASGFKGDETVASGGISIAHSCAVARVGIGTFVPANANSNTTVSVPLGGVAVATGSFTTAVARVGSSKDGGELIDSGSAELDALPDGKEEGLAEALGEDPVGEVAAVGRGGRGGPFRRLYLVSTYVIGKERILLAIRQRCGVRVYVPESKIAVLHLLGLPDKQLSDTFTTDPRVTPVHVVSWGTLGETWPFFRPNFVNMQRIAEEMGAPAVVGFCPSGWLYEKKRDAFPVRIGGSLSVHLVPYSDHSSYTELREYVRWLRPQQVIPTVGVGGDDGERNRVAMLKHFRTLVDETASKARFLAGMRNRATATAVTAALPHALAVVRLSDRGVANGGDFTAVAASALAIEASNADVGPSLDSLPDRLKGTGTTATRRHPVAPENGPEAGGLGLTESKQGVRQAGGEVRGGLQEARVGYRGESGLGQRQGRSRTQDRGGEGSGLEQSLAAAAARPVPPLTRDDGTEVIFIDSSSDGGTHSNGGNEEEDAGDGESVRCRGGGVRPQHDRGAGALGGRGALPGVGTLISPQPDCREAHMADTGQGGGSSGIPSGNSVGLMKLEGMEKGCSCAPSNGFSKAEKGDEKWHG
ncbi:hypothetical protein Vafri_21002, partial [Volvox africanus]